jgi:pimeloyl-ACP methyl ester carboxylesterase
MADAQIEVDGARLRYRDEGAGPPLLLIHGWAFDLDVWQPQARALADRYRVVRYDRRGFGLSTGTPSLQADARDALALLDHLQLRAAAVLGASQGARVALRLALTHPERVSALVLDAPPDEVGAGRGAPTSELPLQHYRELATNGDLPAVRRLIAEHPLNRLLTAEPSTRALLNDVLARYPGNDLLAPTLSQPSILLDFAALRMPVLIINGDSDLHTRLEAGSALADAIVGVHQHHIRDAAHLPNLDNPLAYNALLDTFLEACASGAGAARER